MAKVAETILAISCPKKQERKIHHQRPTSLTIQYRCAWQYHYVGRVCAFAVRFGWPHARFSVSVPTPFFVTVSDASLIMLGSLQIGQMCAMRKRTADQKTEPGRRNGNINKRPQKRRSNVAIAKTKAVRRRRDAQECDRSLHLRATRSLIEAQEEEEGKTYAGTYIAKVKWVRKMARKTRQKRNKKQKKKKTCHRGKGGELSSDRLSQEREHREAVVWRVARVLGGLRSIDYPLRLRRLRVSSFFLFGAKSHHRGKTVGSERRQRPKRQSASDLEGRLLRLCAITGSAPEERSSVANFVQNVTPCS